MLMLNILYESRCLYVTKIGDRTMLMLNRICFYTDSICTTIGDRTMLMLNIEDMEFYPPAFGLETVQC